MHVNGKASLELTSAWQKGRIEVIVCSDLDDEMLGGIKHLKEFKRIPQGFPNTILDENDEFCFRTTIKLLSNEFTSEFDDILSDDLNPLPMKGDTKRISLKPNAIPKKVTGTRRVPLRYEEGADTVVQDLMNKKVIVPVNTTTDWCSPAFFVPKADMIRVRLVTDYTHLNQYVKPPVHPFPSTAEILQAIPSTATCFSKLEAVHGYFQLALEFKSSFITTFLLPQGKFRYLRAPMGLNGSSDEWCCKSDIIVEGLPWARKLVEDTIIWADNEEDLVTRTGTVLERCKANNITIYRKKFEMGKEIEFAGHIISNTGIKPDEKKFSAIRQFPTPTCIKDVRAFLGLANQLGSFIPNLARMTSTM